MQKRRFAVSLALGAALALGACPTAAFAEDAPTHVAESEAEAGSGAGAGSIAALRSDDALDASVAAGEQTLAQRLQNLKVSSVDLPLARCERSVVTADDVLASAEEAYAQAVEAQARAERELAANKTLPVDESLIAAVGTQESTGHSGCCPGFACAYADTIVHGVANSHAAYGCGCCTWPGWGGGNSSFRDLGSSQGVLREAYEQIKAGFPVVTHVRASYGQHWVTLVGYQNVTDPEALSTDNFVCIDPWDGRQFTLSDQFSLYGDNCQHVSDSAVVAA